MRQPQNIRKTADRTNKRRCPLSRNGRGGKQTDVPARCQSGIFAQTANNALSLRNQCAHWLWQSPSPSEQFPEIATPFGRRNDMDGQRQNALKLPRTAAKGLAALRYQKTQTAVIEPQSGFLIQFFGTSDLPSHSAGVGAFSRSVMVGAMSLMLTLSPRSEPAAKGPPWMITGMVISSG